MFTEDKKEQAHMQASYSIIIFYVARINCTVFFFRFTDNVSKSGDSVEYTINVRKLQGSGDIITLTRNTVH